MKISREKLIIILTVFVDVVGIGVVIPVLPYFVQSVSASATTITMLFAVFSLCAFFSAPILGALSDKIGRRPTLIASIASTALGWFVFAGAHSVLVLFLGRIIDGMAAGNFPIAQSYLADLSKSDKERTHNMGLIGAVFGAGFIIGPAIGALLSHISLAFPFWFVGALATANTLAAWIFLPETNLNLAHDKKISVNPFRPVSLAWHDGPLRTRYIVLFLFALAIAVQQSVFALFVQHAFNFGANMTGYFLTAMGVIMVLNQGYLLKNFWLRRFSESKLEIWLLGVFALSFFVMSSANLVVFVAGTLFMVLGQSVLRAVMASRITGFSHASRRGEVAGIMSSLATLGMVIGPLSVGFIYGLNEHLPFIVSGLILLVAFYIMFWTDRRARESDFRSTEAEPLEVL